MKIVDLSHTIETLPEDVPSFLRVEVGYADHADGAVEMERAFGVPPRLMRNGEGPAFMHLHGGLLDARRQAARCGGAARLPCRWLTLERMPPLEQQL